jgi:hypothetical protein
MRAIAMPPLSIAYNSDYAIIHSSKKIHNMQCIYKNAHLKTLLLLVSCSIHTNGALNKREG